MGKFAISRPVTITMFTLFYIALGIGSYTMLTRDLFPNISKPALKIVTEYEGAASKDIEEQITKKLEEQLGAVKGLQNMRSYSGEEKSEIILEFDFGINLDFASIDIREKLDQIQSELPDDAKNPIIERFDPGAQAIIIANISTANELLQANLRQEVEERVKVQLERISGVASVHLSGGNLYEIRIQVDHDELRKSQLSLQEVEKAIQRENVSIRGGRLAEGRTEFLVRTVGSFKTLKHIEDTIIDPARPKTRIRDIASKIEQSPRREDTRARLKTASLQEPIENVQISIFKKPGTNTVKIAQEIRDILETYEKEQEKEKKAIKKAITYDQSVYIEAALNNIKDSAVIGTILAVIVLLVFLRSIESTVIISVSMPISVVASFFLFPMAGMGLNLFSMAGITLAVGMVVDNAIVVIEAVFTNLQNERRMEKAIIVSLTEIGPPVFSSTLTTLAVFVPILFVKGLVGQIFYDLSYTIIFALTFSLLVAFTFIPMLIFQFMGSSFPLIAFFNKIIDKIVTSLLGWFGDIFLQLYGLLLRGVLYTWVTRFLLILAVIALFLFSLLVMPPAELLPEIPEPNISIKIGLPAGLNLGAADKIAKTVEKFLGEDELLKPNIARFTSRVSTKDLLFFIELKEPSDKVMTRIRERIAGMAADIRDFNVTTVSPLKTILAGEGGDIGIRVSGYDLAKISQICKDITDALKKNDSVAPYLTDVQNSMGEGIPELLINVDKVKASDLQVSTEDIAKNIEMAVSGKKVTDVTLEGKENEGQMDVRLALSKIKKSDLGNLQIKPSVSLSKVADIVDDKGPAVIIRDERERIGIVSANIKKGGMALGDITNMLSNQDKKGVLDQFKLEPGYKISLVGTSEAMKKSSDSLLFAMIAAVILVYMVMAGQFESLLHPLAIMFSIPLSVIGAFIGLFLCGINLSVTAYIGIIMLAGIVVNNAIILVDYTNILRARGHDRNEAIIIAGETRLRPIFMTTLTTVLGMLPMAFEQTLYQPLALVVIFGLTFSTFLTLVFIPAIYCFFDDVKELLDFILFKISMLFSKA